MPSYVSRRARQLPEAAGAREVARVIAVAEIGIGHRTSGTRRVHEAAVTRVNADVIDVFRVDAEEDQIARCKLCERHRTRRAQLRRRSARDSEPDLLMYVERKPAAIEAKQPMWPRSERERGRYRIG